MGDRTDYGPHRWPDGTPRYFSATQLTTADPNSYGGCPLRWWYVYIDGHRTPQTKAMERGTKELHEPIERYYDSGAPLSTLALAAAPFMPEPGPDLLIEQEIANLQDITLSPVKVAGVACVGKIDLTHGRGFFIDSTGTLRPEPNPRTIEVKDWKSTSDFQYAKTAAQLRDTVQMNLYGDFGFKLEPEAELVRLSHVNVLTRGRAQARKVTVLTDHESVAQKMEYLDGLGRVMIDVSQEKDPAKVPYNLASCPTYGKGCPHRAYCPRGSSNSIGGLVAAASIKESPAMSLLKKPANPAPTVTELAPPEVGVEIDFMAQLEAEESKKMAAVAKRQLDPKVAAAFDVIESAAMGMPVFSNDVAKAYATHKGFELKSAALTGSGKLAGLQTIDTEAKLLALAEQLAKHAAKSAPAATTPAPAPTTTKVVHNTQATAILPPDAPENDATLAADPAPGLPAASELPASAISTATLIAASAPEKANKKGAKRGPTTTGGLQIFVDCAVAGADLEDLQPMIDHWHTTIVEYYKPDPPDMRCGQDKPLSFGGWKGVLAALVRQCAAELPKASYRVRSSEINDIVIDALCAAKVVDLLVRAAR